MRAPILRICAGLLLVCAVATANAERIDVAASGKSGVVVVAADSQCSLREAMLLGNGAAANSDCVAMADGNTELTINLPPGTRFVLLDGPYAADGPNGLPDVTAKYKIMGHGSSIKRSDNVGTPRFRLLHVASSGDLFIDNASFVNGHTPDGVNGVDGGVGGAGGGIYNDGSLVLAGASVERNATGNGSNIGDGDIYAGDGGKGGGIYNAGTLSMLGAVVDDNATGAGGHCTDDECIGGSGGDGGGVYNDGVLSAIYSRINDNVAADGGNASVGAYSDNAGGDGGNGGGIYNTSQLTLNDTTVGHNVAGDGGIGDYASHGGSGGGIYSISAQVVLATKVTIVDNQAGVSGIVDGNFGDGGGIYCQGSLTLTGSEVENNTVPTGNGNFASGAGAGIYSTQGVLSIATSTISGNLNEVGDGGGIAAYDGTSVSVYQSSLFGNVAARDGGALYTENITSIVNTTIADNTAQLGGGLMILMPGSRISYSTISGNSGGGLDTGRGNQTIASIDHSIIAMQSTGDDCHGDYLPTSTGYNLDSDGTCEFAATGDLSNANPILGALSDNGGPTLSMAPMDGSPALDAIPATTCASNTPPGFDLSVDQRGVTRPVLGTNCDMGAVEQFLGTLRGLGQDGQQALAGDMFAQPLVVQAFDAFGGAVAGVLLDVQVPTSGASASCISEPTDVTGVAIIFCTANATVGSYAVHISIRGAVYSNEDISYTLKNLPNDRIFGSGFTGTALPTAETLP